MAQKIKDTNKDFLGPYDEYEFNGREADIILYIPSDRHLCICIPPMSRARRLLIIVTRPERNRDDAVYIMNKAVKNGLVKKIS